MIPNISNSLFMGNRGGKETKLPAIGEPFQGGYFAGVYWLNGEYRALIVAPRSGESNRRYQHNTLQYGTDHLIDGKANTDNLGIYSPAATHCINYTGGGFTDWYLGSLSEMTLVYTNLKPTNDINFQNTNEAGYNPSAYPPQLGRYTANDPPQTSVPIFISPYGTQAITQQTYWTSSQFGNTGNFAATIDFKNGNRQILGKTNLSWVRPVRSIPILLDTFPGVGEYWQGQGGYFAGLVQYPSDPLVYALILVSKEHEFSSFFTNRNLPATSFSDGQEATNILLTGGNPSLFPHIQHAKNLVVDGHNDFYVPALYEQMILYRAFKVMDISNNTATTITTPVYYPRILQTFLAGSPPQTYFDEFKDGSSQAFNSLRTGEPNDFYFTTTVADSQRLRTLAMRDAGMGQSGRTSVRLSRPIRRIPVDVKEI